MRQYVNFYIAETVWVGQIPLHFERNCKPFFLCFISVFLLFLFACYLHFVACVFAAAAAPTEQNTLSYIDLH